MTAIGLFLAGINGACSGYLLFRLFPVSLTQKLAGYLALAGTGSSEAAIGKGAEFAYLFLSFGTALAMGMAMQSVFILLYRKDGNRSGAVALPSMSPIIQGLLVGLVAGGFVGDAWAAILSLAVSSALLSLLAGGRLWIGADCVIAPEKSRPLSVDMPAFLGILLFAAYVCYDPLIGYRDVDVHEGQQLAWASHLLAGLRPGKELAMSYGPLYSYSLAGFLALTGVTIIQERWYFIACQVAGLACAWLVLRALCRRLVSAVAGMILYLVLTVSFVIWYGYANGLRPGLGLLSILAAWKAFACVKGAGIPWCLAAGLLTGCSILYSPEIGLAALFSAFILSAVLALMMRGDDRPVMVRKISCYCAGIFAVVLVVGAAGLSGTFRERAACLFEYIGFFAGGGFALAFPPLGCPSGHTPGDFMLFLLRDEWLGYVQPAIYAVAAVEATSAIALDRAWDHRRWLRLAVLVFGVASFSVAMMRSDAIHMRMASPAAILLLVALLDLCWNVAAGLRENGRWLMTATALIATGVFLFTARQAVTSFRAPFFWAVGTCWSAKASPEAAMLERDLASGRRVRWSHPRAGMLWTNRLQAQEWERISGFLADHLKPDEPVCTAWGAELAHFLSSHTCPNRYPVSMQARHEKEQEVVVESLAQCRFVVTSGGFMLDGRPWTDYLGIIGREVNDKYRIASTGPLLEVWEIKESAR